MEWVFTENGVKNETAPNNVSLNLIKVIFQVECEKKLTLLNKLQTNQQ